MLSENLKQQFKDLVDKYSQRRSNVIWALDRFPWRDPCPEKPRIRVKAVYRTLSKSSSGCSPEFVTDE